MDESSSGRTWEDTEDYRVGIGAGGSLGLDNLGQILNYF